MGLDGCRVSVKRHDLEAVTRQGQAADLGGAAVQHVQQHVFAGLHADRFAVAEHPPVDGKQAVPDLVAVREAACERGLHGALAGGLQHRVGRCRRQEIHRHVAAAAEGRLKFLQCQEHFLVVAAGLAPGLDVDRPDLAAVLAGVQIRLGAHVTVIKAQASWPGGEGDAPRAASGDEWRALFRRAVDVHRNLLAVPMQLFRGVGIVLDIDDDPAPFVQAQERPRELSIVGRGGDDLVRR